VEGQPKADVMATYLLILALSGYVLDAVVALNMTGLLPLWGLNGQSLLFMGCLLCGVLGFDFLERAQKLVKDKSLKSSKYRPFHYAFFGMPVTAFIILICASMMYGIRLN
jgi:hypothetical protein